MDAQLKIKIFENVLNTIDDNIQENIKKELLLLYHDVIAANCESNIESPNVSKLSLKFIEINLWRYPALLHWTVGQLLCVWSTAFTTTDSALQDMYLKILKKVFREARISVTESSYITNNRIVINKSYAGILLCILSKLELAKMKEKELEVWLCPMLFKACTEFRDIELALYSRKDVKYFRMWHDYLDNIYAKTETLGDLGCAIKSSYGISGIHASSLYLNAVTIFTRIINAKDHWLNNIFNILLTMMKNKFDDVLKIFASPVMSNLPLILYFKLMTDDSNIDSSLLQLLLNKCELNSWEDLTMRRLEKIINDQLNILKWVSTNIKNELNKINTSINKICTELNCSTVLSMLKKFIDLNEKNFEEVEDLLIDCDDSIVIYQSYCAIINALKAILLCDSYSTEPIENITKLCTQMEKNLITLFPLSKRLETIENIFSMIFIRHEDFFEPVSVLDYNGEDEQLRETNSSKKMPGFICNKFALCLIISHLNRCIFVTNNELKLVEDDQIQTRILSLQRYLSEAIWQLELLTNSKFPEIISLSSSVNFENNFYKPHDESSDDNDIKSDIDLSFESGFLSNKIDNYSGKVCRHIKINSNKSILNYMLATQETLVLRCLWKTDYIEAQRIIKTSGMENTRLAGEIVFSREMRTFRLHISKQLTVTRPPNFKKTQIKRSTIDMIRQAAKDGMDFNKTTSQVETFLASQESNIHLCSDQNNPKVILTVTSLDLALTIAHDYSTSDNLINVTMKYLNSCENLKQSSYYEFFQTICQLYYEKKDQSFIVEILSDSRIPFSLVKLKEKMKFFNQLSDKFKLLKNKIRAIDSISVENFDQNEQLDNILITCENDKSYLIRLIAHLHILQTISPKFHELANIRINSLLLENTVNSYIGYQIFYLDTDLEELEKVANKLQINLVYSILVNCCPKLLWQNENNNEATKKIYFKSLNKRIILNQFENNKSYVTVDCVDPNQCIVEILSELLEFLRNHYPNQSKIYQSELKELSQNINFNNILCKTKRLENLDLSVLSFDNHILAFFLNVWNLLILHTMIKIWCQDSLINNLRHTISMKTIGYKIGELGFVTISSLRMKLLSKDISDHELWFDYHGEELNEPAWQDLDLQYDPRVIFAMLNEYQNSPIANIYYPDSLNSSLNYSVQKYLHFYNKNNEKDEIILPIFFQGTEQLIKKFYGNKIILRLKQVNFSCSINLSYVVKENDNMHIQKVNIVNENSIWNYPSNNFRLIQYLKGHCWLLSYLVQRIDKELSSIQNSKYDRSRTSVINKLFNSIWVNNLKPFFENNAIIAGLQKFISTNNMWPCFENNLISKNYLRCLDLLNALSDSFVLKNIEVQKFRDKILTQIIINLDVNNLKILHYLYQIRDEHILTQIVLTKVEEWSVSVCEKALSHCLSHENKNNIPTHCKLKMNEIFCSVMVFDKILPYCKIRNDNTNELSWFNVVYTTEKTDPDRIVKSLIDANQHELCLEWIAYQIASSEVKSLIPLELFIGLLQNEKDDFKQVKKLLSALSKVQSIKFCETVIIDKLVSTSALRFVIGYLLENSFEHKKYQKYLIGIDIINKLNRQERSDYMHLISEPVLMLEQLLMNCKFDNLQRILNSSLDKLKFFCFSSTEDFDKIVRFYAKKSLDLRVSYQRNNIDVSKLREGSLNQSTEFIMPLNVPTRDEWIPNEKSRECSCCKNVIFSMFNRRHHCRRCGRVICAGCSDRGTDIPGYTKIFSPRVCIDCKQQTALQQKVAQDTQSIISSENLNCWKLSCDMSQNQALREEFCFEYAPNISLCLAILNLHSDHEAYANFLQDRCDEMKCLLHPDSLGRINPEIDHGLIIKMIKSLLVAAKVKCSQLGLNTGLTHCDRFISQIDLLAMLVASDCLSLIPRNNLDEHALRKLRDHLTEKELFLLALDVSTKSGLDTQGVWAAWGKASLKVGFYSRARDKFTHCLDKVYHDNFEDWVVLMHPSEKTKSIQNSSLNEKRETVTLNYRPIKDPPLLIEILQILGTLNSTEQYVKGHLSEQKSPAAQEIINNLNNLKATSHGCYTIPKLSANPKNIQYQESLYYLSKYGSFNSILEFFVRYEEYDKCLSYILENNIGAEIFFDTVFMGSLKKGKMMNLCDAMKSNDSSLLTWKKSLIFVCHCLEKAHLYHTLYEVQLFMRDYIRCAMTCIRFYVTDASNYSNICTRTHYLIDAQKHFESELQIETFYRKRRKSTTSSSSNYGGSLTMEMEASDIDKHINTISRQMEVAKFLGSCEEEGRSVGYYLSKLSFMESEGLQPRSVPTLFGTSGERTHLAVLAILCGRDVEEGFGIAFRIMQDYSLRPQKVYSLVGHILALDKRVNSIEQLIKCCRSSGAPNSISISDRVLAHCVKLLLDKTKSESSLNLNQNDQIDGLIRIITDVELKISSYIESRQLKAAYLLAVKHSRSQDIRKILREADRLGHSAIMSICNKWLQQNQKD